MLSLLLSFGSCLFFSLFVLFLYALNLREMYRVKIVELREFEHGNLSV